MSNKGTGSIPNPTSPAAGPPPPKIGAPPCRPTVPKLYRPCRPSPRANKLTYIKIQPKIHRRSATAKNGTKRPSQRNHENACRNSIPWSNIRPCTSAQNPSRNPIFSGRNPTWPRTRFNQNICIKSTDSWARRRNA